MQVKRDKLFELMQTQFYGRNNRLAVALEVDPSHLHRVINDGIGGGKKISGAIIKFCNKNDLDFTDYIDL